MFFFHKKKVVGDYKMTQEVCQMFCL